MKVQFANSAFFYFLFFLYYCFYLIVFYFNYLFTLLLIIYLFIYLMLFILHEVKILKMYTSQRATIFSPQEWRFTYSRHNLFIHILQYFNELPPNQSFFVVMPYMKLFLFRLIVWTEFHFIYQFRLWSQRLSEKQTLSLCNSMERRQGRKFQF